MYLPPAWPEDVACVSLSIGGRCRRRSFGISNGRSRKSVDVVLPLSGFAVGAPAAATASCARRRRSFGMSKGRSRMSIDVALPDVHASVDWVKSMVRRRSFGISNGSSERSVWNLKKNFIGFVQSFFITSVCPADCKPRDIPLSEAAPVTSPVEPPSCNPMLIRFLF